MKWVPEESTRDLPERIRTYFVEEASHLLYDLENHTQQIVLVPIDNPPVHQRQKRRSETCGNPEWYSQLHRNILHFRRNWTKKALSRIINGLDKKLDITNTRYTFDTLFRSVILDRLVQGYQEEDVLIPHNQEVKEYFEAELGYFKAKNPALKTSKNLESVPF